MGEVHTYFRKRPRVALLDVYAIESIIAPFLNPCSLQVMLSETAQRQLAHLKQWVEQSELEVLETCCKYDLGLSMLTAEPAFVDELIARCYSGGFPFGLQAKHELLNIAGKIPELPTAALSVQNIHVQSIVLLRHIARGHTLNRLEVLRADSLWSQDDWDAYFAAFPNDEFRIPVVSAARALYKRQPSIFTGSLYYLFGKHCEPRENPLFVKQSWQEADQQQRDEGAIGY